MKFAFRAWQVMVLSLTPFVVQSQDLLIAAKKDSKWGYVNPAGTYVIPPRFDEASPFSEGLSVVKEKGLYGVIDPTGKFRLAPLKGLIDPEVNSNRITGQNESGKWGVRDLKGKEKGNFTYDAISTFSSGFVIAGKKTSVANLVHVTILDTLGFEIISFDNIYLPEAALVDRKKVREGYLCVLVDGEFAEQLTPSEWKLEGRTLHFALLDVRNKKLINAKIPSLQTEVREGRLNLTIDGISYSWSVPLSSEPNISEAKFSFLASAIHPFSGGIAAIARENRWAFLDKDGSLISETNLPVASYTSDNPLYYGGFVIFQKNGGTYIFTDLNGKQKIALELEEAKPFFSGYSICKYNGKYGLLQKDGNWAIPPTYDELRY